MAASDTPTPESTPQVSSPTESCPCRGVTLERLVRPAVMMILARGDQYGYRIVQQLAEMPIFGGQKPNTAGVYRCLKLLEQEGSVSSSWDVTGRGPAKRQYTLTPAGEQCLATWMLTLTQYRQALDDLLALGQEILTQKSVPTPACRCKCT